MSKINIRHNDEYTKAAQNRFHATRDPNDLVRIDLTRRAPRGLFCPLKKPHRAYIVFMDSAGFLASARIKGAVQDG